MTVRRAILLVGMLPVLAVVGCGTTGAGAGVASLATAASTPGAAAPSPTASSDPLKFAQCMRENGVDMKDPVDGRIQIRAKGADQGLMEAAQKACGKYLQGGKLDARQDPEARDRLVKFAECMRKNGVDMEDPDFADGGGIKITRPKGGDSEAFETAMKTCQELLPGRPPS
ncbi:hypothetical protein Misp01_30400 [Microtetraspora sp. NBRC 13810]|uniref:hypothetical protein n=1 Tax=Microtetraspora sp. NBRC 13810 TaxID=3030990 RepID=UPI0024A24CC1|nr:hypothetical protein [Microtetraspora sp. NBRC 13810]GLW07910.1 hypothetical protein Misp01_30400 [Microtetraspora sp. NBRC 13810]